MPDFQSESFAPPSPLMTLVLSQSKQPMIRQSSLRPLVKKFEPPVPEKNIWGRPLARRRKVNIRKRWYAKVLDSALPFLPEQDLNMLHRLASGEEKWNAPKRRAKGVSQPSTQVGPTLTADFLRFGAPKGPTFERFARGRPHHITPRLMRRLWEQVCIFTPRMAWNDKSKSWSVAWGLEKAPKKGYIEVDSERANSLFGGLAANGKPPPQKKERRRTEKSSENARNKGECATRRTVPEEDG